MKFTSEDLLKAMGLKVGQTLKFNHGIFKLAVGSKKNIIILQSEHKDIGLGILIDEEYEIIQSKPTLTEDEKVILRNTPCTEISREMNDDGFEGVRENLWLIKGEIKYDFNLFRHLFKSIPIGEKYSIEELLGE